MEEEFNPRDCAWLSVYSTRSGAQSALNRVNEAFIADLVALGHEVDESGCVIPKNAESGLSDYSASRVECWDTLHQFDASTFYFSKYNKEILDGE